MGFEFRKVMQQNGARVDYSFIRVSSLLLPPVQFSHRALGPLSARASAHNNSESKSGSLSLQFTMPLFVSVLHGTIAHAERVLVAPRCEITGSSYGYLYLYLFPLAHVTISLSYHHRKRMSIPSERCAYPTTVHSHQSCTSHPANSDNRR